MADRPQEMSRPAELSRVADPQVQHQYPPPPPILDDVLLTVRYTSHAERPGRPASHVHAAVVLCEDLDESLELMCRTAT